MARAGEEARTGVRQSQKLPPGLPRRLGLSHGRAFLPEDGLPWLYATALASPTSMAPGGRQPLTARVLCSGSTAGRVSSFPALPLSRAAEAAGQVQGLSLAMCCSFAPGPRPRAGTAACTLPEATLCTRLAGTGVSLSLPLRQEGARLWLRGAILPEGRKYANSRKREATGRMRENKKAGGRSSRTGNRQEHA